MNKKKLTELKALAATLPDLQNVLPKGVQNIKSIGHEKNSDGTYTGRRMVLRTDAVDVNHFRRIKRAYLRDGDAGVRRYIAQVEQFVSQNQTTTNDEQGQKKGS